MWTVQSTSLSTFAYGVAGLDPIKGASLEKSPNGHLGEEAKDGSLRSQRTAPRENLKLASRLSPKKVARVDWKESTSFVAEALALEEELGTA